MSYIADDRVQQIYIVILKVHSQNYLNCIDSQQ